MHPTKPFSRNLGTIIIHIHMFCKFNPTISAIEIIWIFVILIAVFVGANQCAYFQIIVSASDKIYKQESNYILQKYLYNYSRETHLYNFRYVFLMPPFWRTISKSLPKRFKPKYFDIFLKESEICM